MKVNHSHEHHHIDEHHNHHNHSSHDHHHHHHGDFKKIFFLSLPFGLLVMWLSPLMGVNIPFPFHYTFKYSDILALLLSLGLLIYGGRPFILGAIDEFRQKSPGMMALVSLGLLVSFIYSLFAIILRYINNQVYMDFLFEFASLILIMLLGHWIEMVALSKAGDAKESLAKLLPKNAFVKVNNDKIVEKPINELKINDIIIIQAGENIAADGIIINGNSRVNESLITGESKPVQKNIGDEVIGGSTNEFGKLEVKVTKLGKDSYLSQVENFKNKGLKVIMMGDGINDSPLLTLADVGVAIGAGTQVAIDSADVILTNSEPCDVESFIELSVRTNKKMNENLLWGAGYNFFAIPLAAGVLSSIGIVITPALGAILMSLSTIIVSLNAMTLNMKRGNKNE